MQPGESADGSGSADYITEAARMQEVVKEDGVCIGAWERAEEVCRLYVRQSAGALRNHLHMQFATGYPWLSPARNGPRAPTEHPWTLISRYHFGSVEARGYISLCSSLTPFHV